MDQDATTTRAGAVARFPRSELPPGACKVVTLGRREVAVFNVDGRLYAVFNRCPHQQAPLAPGYLGGTVLPADEVGVGGYHYGMAGRVLRCPWHHYEFDLASGDSIACGKLRVKSYAVRFDGDDVVVDAGAPGRPAASPVA